MSDATKKECLRWYKRGVHKGHRGVVFGILKATGLEHVRFSSVSEVEIERDFNKLYSLYTGSNEGCERE